MAGSVPRAGITPPAIASAKAPATRRKIDDLSIPVVVEQVRLSLQRQLYGSQIVRDNQVAAVTVKGYKSTQRYGSLSKVDVEVADWTAFEFCFAVFSPSTSVTVRRRAVAGSGAVTSGSDVASSSGGRRDSHRATAACGAGSRRLSLPLRSRARLILGSSEPWAGRSSRCAAFPWRRSSDGSLDASPAPSGSLGHAVSLDGPPCRSRAPMQNLSHGASCHCWLNNAPSIAGTKHLEHPAGPGRRRSRPPA